MCGVISLFCQAQEIVLRDEPIPENRSFYLQRWTELRTEQLAAATTACLVFLGERHLPIPSDEQLAEIAVRAGVVQPEVSEQVYGTSDPVSGLRKGFEDSYNGRFFTHLFWWKNGFLVEYSEASSTRLTPDADLSTVWFDNQPEGVVRVQVSWVGGPSSYATVSTNPAIDPTVDDLLGQTHEQLKRYQQRLRDYDGKSTGVEHILCGHNGDVEITTVTSAKLTHVVEVAPSWCRDYLRSFMGERSYEVSFDPNSPPVLSVLRFSRWEDNFRSRRLHEYRRVPCSEFSGRSLLAFLRRSDFELTSLLELLAKRGIQLKAADNAGAKILAGITSANQTNPREQGP
jgi:hypothetical protein